MILFHINVIGCSTKEGEWRGSSTRFVRLEDLLMFGCPRGGVGGVDVDVGRVFFLYGIIQGKLFRRGIIVERRRGGSRGEQINYNQGWSVAKFYLGQMVTVHPSTTYSGKYTTESLQEIQGRGRRGGE